MTHEGESDTLGAPHALLWLLGGCLAILGWLTLLSVGPIGLVPAVAVCLFAALRNHAHRAQATAITTAVLAVALLIYQLLT